MDEGVIRSATQQAARSYSEIFDECFPFYLSIGMSSTEYWEGDNDLPKYYRKAFKMRQENANHEAWLHGLYVYDAIVSAMTHISKQKSDHKQYAEKPYDFTLRKEEERIEEAEAQAEVWLKSWVSATQKKFEKK